MTFTANSAFNELNVGDKVSESFEVTSIDGTKSSVTVTSPAAMTRRW
ncbi:VCBS domain-containing protein [Aeromonas hydrophila]|nr:VCBS domain-containing protein [Aeromonas hydrophila]